MKHKNFWCLIVPLFVEMGVLDPFESSSRWLVVGMASGEDDGCLILRNCMLVVVVEDGADVVRGVDGVVCCCHTFI